MRPSLDSSLEWSAAGQRVAQEQPELVRYHPETRVDIENYEVGHKIKELRACVCVTVCDNMCFRTTLWKLQRLKLFKFYKIEN